MKRLVPILLSLLVCVPGTMRADVIISEFVAENDEGFEDEDGNKSDWIELLNTGAASVDLAGWRLTDDLQSPAKWQFPAVTLDPGERLVVFASGKDRRVAGAELHTNFSLNNSGEYLALRRPDGAVASEFAPAFPRQRADISFGEGVLVDGEELIVASSTGKWTVPANGAMGTTWTMPGFADTGWANATSRLGYQGGPAGPGQPVAYWTFDDVATNEVPGGPVANLNGAQYSAAVPGAIGGGKSLQFAASGNNYVSAQLDVSETAYTCSLWFRTTSPSIGIFTVTDGDLGSGGYDRLMYLTGGNIAARTWNNETITSTGKNYADGQWHHVAHVFGGAVGGQKLFVDGVQVASGAKAQSDFNWQQRINIGFTNDAGANAYFNGEIDDVAIWSEALNTASIQSLAAGTSPVEIVGYGPYIGTNTQAAMQNVNASAYLRLPFNVNRAMPFNAATLRVRYDDGFVAYLDGVEIARRNAPAGTPPFNATATADRPTDAAVYFETIDISAHAGLLGNGAHVLAIHALNDAAASANFLLNVELFASTNTPQPAIYMDPPTPGQPNSTGFAGFVADTVFTPKRGFFTSAQNVTITSATPGASIAYTTDGSDPSPTNGTQVHAPDAATPPVAVIPVSTTRYIRAMSYKAGYGLRPTNVDSHTYIFQNQVLTQPAAPPGFNTSWNGRAADYAMDPSVVNSTLPGYGVIDALLSLPSVSMTCPTGDLFDAPSGIYYNTGQRGLSAERKVSIEWINPDGSPGWHVQCGTRIHGNSSRGHGFTPKHSMRLHFRDDYGYPKLRRDLFGGGVEKFDQVLLRACSTDSMPVIDGNIEDGEQRWNNDKATYMRDQYMRDLLIEIGSPNCRGRYVHLFINGLYWGLYNLTERPTASYFADTFGGGRDEWDVLKDFQEVHDGNATAWNEMRAIVQDGTISDAVRCQKLLGNNPDGSRNPAYPIYIHWPSFRDYMIAHIAAGAEDWPDHNYWAGRRRGPLSEGFRFVAWDQEISNDSLTRLSGRGSALPFEAVGASPGDDAYAFGPAKIYDKFRRVEPFKTEFRERIHALLFNGGALTPGAQRARWAVRQAEIDKAVVGESARWGDANGEGAKKRETTWLNNMNYMNAPGSGYWDAIHPIVVQRFRNVGLYPGIDQPSFSQPGGNVPAGFQLYITHAEPQIYYTLDGTDPIGPGGAPSSSAVPYDGGLTVEVPVPAGAIWKYLAQASAPSSAWKNVSFNDSSWTEGQAQLGYGDGDEATVISFGGNPSNRYMTTYFRKSFTITDKATLQSARVRLLRDDGAVVWLNGQELARSNMHPTNPISYFTAASTNVTGVDETSYFYEIPVDLSKLSEGTNVIAVEVHKVSVSEDDLSFDCAVEVVRSSAASGITLNQSGTVTARARTASGEWSGAISAYFNVGNSSPSSGNLVFSEVHYHPAAPVRAEELAVSADADDFEFIELMNISATPVDLTGVKFSSGVQFAFQTGFALAPGARCVVVKNLAAFEARYGAGRNVAGVFANGSGLSNAGEGITLIDASGAVLRSFAYDDSAPWPVSADGAGPSLLLVNPASNPDHTLPSNWVASADFGGSPSESEGQQNYTRWSSAYGGALVASADDDGDSMPNAIEYALARNPHVQELDALPVAGFIEAGGQTYLSITFRRRSAATDLAVIVELSTALPAFEGPPQTVLVTSQDHGDGTVTETWRSAAPLLPGARQFLRVRALISP